MARKTARPSQQSDHPSPLENRDLDTALRATLYRQDCPDTIILGDYHLELLPDVEKKQVQRHLDRCAYCQAELARLGQFLAGEINAVVVEASPLPNPSWQEILLDYGRAWLERGTGRWRQVQVALANLGRPTDRAAAMAGLMSEGGEPIPAAQGSLIIAPVEADFGLELTITHDPTNDEEGLCQLEVVLTLGDRLSDLSGTQVTLLWGDQTQIQGMNALGEVTFADLPCDQLSTMGLLVRLPESDL